MVGTNFIIFSMALCFVMGLALAVGEREEIENDVGSDVVPNDLTQKRNLNNPCC